MIVFLIFPQVPGRSSDNASALAVHRVKVFHAALLKILESAKTAGRDGFSFGIEDQRLLAKFIIAILSMDYEEAYVLSNLPSAETHSLTGLVRHQYLAQSLILPVPFVWFRDASCGILLENTHSVQENQQ